VLEFAFDTRRGSFRLEFSARFTAQWTVIFGHSGAGKSTLLRLLAGLERPERGRVDLNGAVLTDTAARAYVPPGHRGCALVTQQPALFPHMRVGWNVRYGIRERNVAVWMGRVEETLDLAGASDLIARRPHELSGGEAQRVALARALAVQPRLLLLDEPFSALDGTAADALLERLKPWLAERNVQTVMVTHDATDAYATGADVALIQDGRMIAQGPAHEVLAQERNRITARLAQNVTGVN
jgi:ABC-type sulfate/molybdate transport systems ATPase subunit